ncbi:hypothetical protein ID866_8496 [Astraeus odoratus]|nr:hypothetical protein ID866_8496 [Astraeus odoratus]
MILNPVALLTILRAADIRPDNAPACLANNFYGTFGEQSVFKLSDLTCLDLLPSSLDGGGSLVPLDLPDVEQKQLVWLQESSIESTLRTPDYEAEVADFARWLVSHEPYSTGQGQTVLLEHGAPGPVSLVYEGADSAIVAVADQSAAHALSAYLPRYWKASPIPPAPVSYLPVPDAAVEHVRDLLATLRHDPLVASIVGGISVDQLRRDIRYLTNEDGRSGIVSRHSFHQGSRVAAAWLREQFEDAGATCDLVPFSPGFAPNVVCRYAGTAGTSDTVLISGHYDSRGSFGMERAPGGNDDGSGTISILSIARRIKQTGITFRNNVELVAFAGEEQGLYGSRAYAHKLRENNANITLMIQADMIAYHVPEEPPQLGLPRSIGTPEVTQLVANISAIYSPELSVGFTSACCSDHQSFHQEGYPATQVFERTGPIADPMYHNSGDFSDRPGYDLYQVRSICKVQFATLLHAAGFDLSKGANLEELE